jgi:hypothetical protein
MSRLLKIAAAFVVTLSFTSVAGATDYYVSAARGKGRKGSKDKPCKDIGNVIKKLQPGDTIHVAQGVYLGKSESGHDWIKVPVSIVGGYDDSFTKRDPWGDHKTVLSGVNTSKNYQNKARLFIDLSKWNKVYGSKRIMEKFDIVVDGLIIDNGARNGFKKPSNLLISRKANPKTGANATPDRPGIQVMAQDGASATIQNCVVMNCGPAGMGALQIAGQEKSKCVVRNNLVINNTGYGIFCKSLYHPRDGKGLPTFAVENNTVLFTEKYDAFGTTGGCSFMADSDAVCVIKRNLFAYADQYGAQVKGKTGDFTYLENCVTANLKGDLLEFDTVIAVDAWEDDTEVISEDSVDNVGGEVKVPVSAEWSEKYFKRAVIDRNAAEADVKAKDSKMNALRGMLGLPKQAPTLKLDSDVWLPLMSLEDAMTCSKGDIREGYGCKTPAP